MSLFDCELTWDSAPEPNTVNIIGNRFADELICETSNISYEGSDITKRVDIHVLMNDSYYLDNPDDVHSKLFTNKSINSR